MSEILSKEWVEEAKKHFESIKQDPKYKSEDEKAKQSKRIKNDLQKYLDGFLQNYKDLKMDKRGNKWAKQGHRELNESIWFRIYLNVLGADYPVIVNVGIGEKGLHYVIDVYEKKVPDEVLRKKIEEILSESITELCKDKDFNTNADDFGYKELSEHDEEKLKTIIECYEKVVCLFNRKVFEKIINQFNSVQTSSKHCKIYNTDDELDEFYKRKKEFKKFVKDFLESSTPTKEKLEQFWKKEYINSAQQRGNLTNVLNEYNSDNEEFKKALQELVSIKYDPNDSKEVQNKIQEEIKGAKNSALEFYYLYHMEDDNFPLINGASNEAIKFIEKNCCKLASCNDLTDEFWDKFCKCEKNLICKFASLKEKINPKNGIEEKYYLLDQLLNLLHKIHYEDVKTIKDDDENKELYQLAYLFTFFHRKRISTSDEFDDLLERSKNIIFYGAPGTGKTYSAMQNIERIIEEDYPNSEIEESRFLKVQFHPSYSYEDFVEGLKPIKADGGIAIQLVDGKFRKFCEIAARYEDKYEEEKSEQKLKWAFFILIDEINRAEVARVFGELLFAIEDDKRGIPVMTQYAYMRDEEETKELIVPKNLYIIGTMNDVDRSIDNFDLALRRRFLWERMDCDYGVIYDEFRDIENIGRLDDNNKPQDGYLKQCYNLNEFITSTNKKNEGLGLGKTYELGHAYFMKIENFLDKANKIEQKHLKKLFDYHLSPLIKEYLRAEYDEEAIEEKLK